MADKPEFVDMQRGDAPVQAPVRAAHHRARDQGKVASQSLAAAAVGGLAAGDVQTMEAQAVENRRLK